MQTVLEDLVDQTSLADVIEALSNVAHCKSEHILTNWQDQDLAECWTRAAEAIARVSLDAMPGFFLRGR